MPRLSRLAFAFLLIVALAFASALAAGPLPEAVPRLSVAENSVATDAVARLWSFLAGLWSKNGCQVNPDGQCLPSSGSTGKIGCQVDPHGNCLQGTGSTTATAKNGCEVDPHGRCLP